jgi:hypothetical protein
VFSLRANGCGCKRWRRRSRGVAGEPVRVPWMDESAGVRNQHAMDVRTYAGTSGTCSALTLPVLNPMVSVGRNATGAVECPRSASAVPRDSATDRGAKSTRVQRGSCHPSNGTGLMSATTANGKGDRGCETDALSRSPSPP